MLDPYSYTSPARVKSLFIPLDELPNDLFLNYFENFKDNYQIRLVDVTPRPVASDTNTVNRFNPQGFPLGSVIYDHQLAQIDNQEVFLQDFEPFRKIFVVVGFIKYTENLTLDKLNLHLKNLKKAFKYSIVHNIVVFDSLAKDQLSNPNDSSIFHVEPKNNTDSQTVTSQYSIMCDITSNLLNALNSYAQSFQHVTLRSPGSINSNDVLKIATTNHTSSHDIPETSSATEIVGIKETLTSSTGTGVKGTEKIKDSKNKGRHLKISGNFYLLAGRYTDALREFGEALPLLKSSNDYLWLANTLEYVGVCLVLLSFLNIPYQLPNTLLKFLSTKDKGSAKNTPNGSPRNSLSRSNTIGNISGTTTSPGSAVGSSASNNTFSLDRLNMQVPEIISQLTSKVLMYYSLTFNNHEDYVPQLVYCETIIRFAKFMTIIHVGNGFTTNVLNHIVLNTPITEKKFNEYFYSKLEIFKFTNRLFTVQLQNMNLSSQCKVYCSLASIYDDLEFYRKKTFIIRTLFLKLIPELTKTHFEKSKKSNYGSVEDKELIDKSAAIFNRNQQLQTQMELNSKLLAENSDSTSITKSAGSNEFLIKLLNSLLLIYGVGVSPKTSTNNFKKTPWFLLHKSVLNLCIDICKSIIDFKGIIFFSSILLSKYLNTLSKSEQVNLFALIRETQQKAKNVNQVIKCFYWDPFLIRDINLLHDFDETLLPIKLKELPSGTNTTIEAPLESSSNTSTPSPSTRNSKIMTSAVIYNPFEENKKNQAKLKRRSLKRLSGFGLSKTTPKSNNKPADDIFNESADVSTTSIAEEDESAAHKKSQITGTGEEEEVDGEQSEEEYEDVVEVNYENEGVLLVQDEVFTLLVKVQNPFQFDIEINEVSIRTDEEVQVETIANNNQNHFTINGDSVTTIRVAVRPLNYGNLKIIGAEVKVSNCEKQFFKIISKEKYQVLEKIKKCGIEANLPSNKKKANTVSNLIKGDNASDKVANRVEFKNLNLVVITPQPILSLIDLSLNNGWIMLLEGEKSSFKILLKNLSNIKINYLAFSFLDSTIEPLTKALQSKDLPINEIYEIEYYLLKRKPLRIQKSEINKLKFIKPLDFLSLTFDIKGKRGMRDAQIILDYGNQFTRDSNPANDDKACQFSNFFRRISIPISVTVSPSVELAGCDLIPLFNNVNELNEEKINIINAQNVSNKLVQDMKELALEQKNIWSYLNKRTTKISEYCLLVIDLRNSWNQKFRVTLNSSDFVFPTSEEFDNASDHEKASFGSDKDSYIVSETIAPGHTERFILPIKRIEFSTEYLERSIPSLRNKQFIVQDNRYTKEEFKYIREAFWYRKELLRHIKGRWVEDGSKREGYIELRGIRLSQRMVSVLRIEKIGIEMSLVSDSRGAQSVTADEDGNNTKNNGLYWEVQTEQLVTIRTKIINRSNYDLRGIIRHVPLSNNGLPIDRRILYNGVLQLNIAEPIKPGESQEFDLGIVILEKGEYEWGAIFDEQIFNKNNVDLQHTQREPLFIRAV